MNLPGLSDDADSLYRPLGDLTLWAEVVVDNAAWAPAVARLDRTRGEAPPWAAMVTRGARLAAAHQSAGLDGLVDGSKGLALAILAAECSLGDLGDHDRQHVQAIDQALTVAAGAPSISEAVIGQVHEVACRPQLTHGVQVEDRIQEHIFAHGEYKHHPNHLILAAGGWRARAPVAQVGDEMARLVRTLDGADFGRLHSVVQAAYVLYALHHVGPFADGNARVARVLAGALIWRATLIPLLVLADDGAAYERALAAADAGDGAALVDFVLSRVIDLVAMIADVRSGPGSEAQTMALDRWQARTRAAQSLADRLPGAVENAVVRHRARGDLGWLSPLAEVEVSPLAIRVCLADGLVVDEVFSIDVHPPEDAGTVVLTAREASVLVEIDIAASPSSVSTRLDPWLDRVVSTLSLRVAAELE